MPDAAPSPATARRRQRILEVAARVFAKEGFRHTDVQVIADLARAGKGTIYRHFGNKQELFLATVRANVEWLADYVLAQLDGAESAADHLRRIAVSCAEYCQHHPDLVELTIQERAEFRESVFPTALMFRSDNSGGLEEMIRAGVATGEFRDVDPHTTSIAFLDLVFGTVVCGCLEGGSRQLTTRIDRAVDMFLAGVAADPSALQDSKDAAVDSHIEP